MGINFSQVNRRGSPGFRDGWQRHHLIPHSCLRDTETAIFWASLIAAGFKLADFGANGILLPATYADSARYGLPYHSGSHPNYSRRVRNAIRALAVAFDFANSVYELHRAKTYLHLLIGRLRIAMSQDVPISIDDVVPKVILFENVSIKRAIDTMDWTRLNPPGRKQD